MNTKHNHSRRLTPSTFSTDIFLPTSSNLRSAQAKLVHPEGLPVVPSLSLTGGRTSTNGQSARPPTSRHTLGTQSYVLSLNLILVRILGGGRRTEVEPRFPLRGGSDAVQVGPRVGSRGFESVGGGLEFLGGHGFRIFRLLVGGGSHGCR